MLCCLNPDCSNPLNPAGNNHCQECDTPLIPLLRGHYRIIKVLSNEGGFGRTYLAEDVDKLNEKCVVKQLAPKTQEPIVVKKAIELFKQEARQLQQLGEHNQIPSLYAYFEQDNYLYLVQQYIDGQNLLKELYTQGTYGESQIRDLLLDLLPVLKYIHSHGVIHRDIKLQNIIRRSSDGKFVLIDFGASKQLTATVHKVGTAIGSHGYTAPEQLQKGQAYPASDLYSLGVTCFYLLTGISPSKLWMEHGFGWVNDWRRYINVNNSVLISRELGDFLDQLLKADIQKRYQSADEARTHLTYLINYTSNASSKLLAPSSLQTKLTQRTQLNNLLKNQLLLFGVILVLCLSIGWYSQYQSKRIQETQNGQLTNTDAPKTLRGHSSDVNSVVFAPDGKMLASSSDDKTIKLWNPVTGQSISTLKGDSDWIWDIAFSPDGKILASCGADKTIKLWDVATGLQIRTLKGHTNGVTSVAISPDGKQLASSSLDKTIKLWNITNGQEVRTLKGHSQAVDNVIFSPDGVTLASGSWDNTIKLWNLTNGQEIRTLKGHSDFVLSIAFDAKGVMLASGSKDKTIKLWNLVTGELSRTIKAHTDKVNSVTFASGANYSKAFKTSEILISGSNDNTIKLWNPATGEEIRTLKQDSGFIYSIATSPDGQTIASGGSAGNILKIWQIP
ncbi:serine/threonine protein kinase with WD-40 repeats [Calothrix sp. NIES-4071]|nr:serine/threonine protein kinase with WD-40 repeats [Calothrix sp. NIES-4071]BAZ61524.1 serine/threonine protein kinase with WD-40 repeats [Calothrix sp. NIES-4105]